MSTPPVYGHDSPGSSGTEYNLLAFIFQTLLAKVQTVSLVKVIECSNAGGLSPGGTVTVRPMVNQVSGGPQDPTPHGNLFQVPYFRLQGGANAVILDPKQDDIGVCLFCSRDSARVRATKDYANPASFAQFDWSDGLYLGGFLNGTPSQYVQFTDRGINIVSPDGLTLTGGGKTVTIDASGVTIDGVLWETHVHPPGTYHIGSDPVLGESGSPQAP